MAGLWLDFFTREEKADAIENLDGKEFRSWISAGAGIIPNVEVLVSGAQVRYHYEGASRAIDVLTISRWYLVIYPTGRALRVLRNDGTRVDFVTPYAHRLKVYIDDLHQVRSAAGAE